MATALLRPQDCSTKIPFIHVDAMCASRVVSRSKPVYGGRQNSNPNSRRRRRSPSDEKSYVRGRVEEAIKPVKEAKELVMGKVRILKRGDTICPNISEEKSGIDRRRSVRFEKEDVILCSTDRLGPEPEVMHSQFSICETKTTGVDRFAGCVAASPPPSSLPIPMKCWLTKEKCDVASMAMDLRRILRLDLI